MRTRLMSYLVETVYTTFVVFFYIYAFMTLVQLQPFAFGFHPPTDFQQLSPMLLMILAGVSILKLLPLFSEAVNDESAGQKPISYFPAQRH